jgi:hypothetical protein
MRSLNVNIAEGLRDLTLASPMTRSARSLPCSFVGLSCAPPFLRAVFPNQF